MASGLTAALRLSAPAVLLSVLVLAPFHDKAFTIDDALFLRQAEQILVDPWRPGAYDVVWEQDVPIRVAVAYVVSGPVTGYLLAPAVLAGGSESLAHLTMWLLLCLSAVATSSYALRLGYERWKAAVAAMLLVSTPAVVGMAGTVMPDLPAMALGVMAAERYAAWLAERRAWQGAAAAVLLAISILTRSHMISLPVILGAPHLLAWFTSGTEGNEGRPRVWWWLPLAGAFLVVLALQLATYDFSPRTVEALPFLSVLLNWRQIPGNLLAFGVHWVLAFPLGLAWLVMRWRALRWFLAAGMLAALCVPIPRSAPRWSALVAALGFLVIADVLHRAYTRRDWVQLSLGLWLLAGLVTLPYAHHPSKYEVPAAPAAALLIVGQLPPLPSRRTVAGLTACILGGTLLGVAILRADAVWAGQTKQAAAELIKPEVDAGRRVWFVGHWGFQRYAEKAGARPVTRIAPFPELGDLVVASLADECPALTYLPRRSLVRRLVYNSTTGGRVMSREAQAGFFSNEWGYLPWSWGTGEINRFEVWRIE